MDATPADPAPGDPAPVEQSRGLLTEEEFDGLIREIRSGTAVAAFLFAHTSYLALVPSGTRWGDVGPGQRTLVVGELAVYAVCAVGIFRCARWAATLLFFACVAAVCIALARTPHWTVVPGFVFILIASLSMRRTRRLHQLLAAARAASATA